MRPCVPPSTSWATPFRPDRGQYYRLGRATHPSSDPNAPIAGGFLARLRSWWVGIAFLADLARQRSLASAALLFLMLIDEIEGLVFVALGVVMHRIDLFLGVQDVLFPTIVIVAGVVSLARNWRRRAPAEPLPAPETLELAVLSQRIGSTR